MVLTWNGPCILFTDPRITVKVNKDNNGADGNNGRDGNNGHDGNNGRDGNNGANGNNDTDGNNTDEDKDLGRNCLHFAFKHEAHGKIIKQLFKRLLEWIRTNHTMSR